MKIAKIHHVAYRCNDAKETVEWYRTYLNMDFVLAFAEDTVPSTGAPDPYMHIFLDAGNGNILAFFELPTQPAMGRDPNTPDWVQHLALQVESQDDLLETHPHAPRPPAKAPKARARWQYPVRLPDKGLRVGEGVCAVSPPPRGECFRIRAAALPEGVVAGDWGAGR